MEIRIVEESPLNLTLYGTIPSRVNIDKQLVPEVRQNGFGGIVLTEKPVIPPQVKNYDDLEPPSRWGKLWDLKNWGLFYAYTGKKLMGGCLIAFDTLGVNLLENRNDLTILWDIRVDPQFQGRGVGSILFKRAQEWSIKRGARFMKIETQANNLPACHFYRSMGCQIRSLDLFAYPGLKEEVQIIWWKPLG